MGQLQLRLENVKAQSVAAAAVVVHGDRLEVLAVVLEPVTAGASKGLTSGLVLHLVRVQVDFVGKLEIGGFLQRLAARAHPAHFPAVGATGPLGLQQGHAESGVGGLGEAQHRLHRVPPRDRPVNRRGVAVHAQALVATGNHGRLVVFPVTGCTADIGEFVRIVHRQVGVLADLVVAVQAGLVPHHLEGRLVAGLALLRHPGRLVGGHQRPTRPEAVIRQGRAAQGFRQLGPQQADCRNHQGEQQDQQGQHPAAAADAPGVPLEADIPGKSHRGLAGTGQLQGKVEAGGWRNHLQFVTGQFKLIANFQAVLLGRRTLHRDHRLARADAALPVTGGLQSHLAAHPGQRHHGPRFPAQGQAIALVLVLQGFAAAAAGECTNQKIHGATSR